MNNGPDIQLERRLLAEALELEDANARNAYLDRMCAGRDTLRARIERLLAATARADALFSPTGYSASGSASASGDPGECLTQIGRYKLLERIGEGGHGMVYLAEQQQPVKRQVALKIIRLGMDTARVIARFEAERQSLAMMEHPYIAQVLDAGATESGRPFFVMELVRGEKLCQFCDRKRLGARERLELFIKVCRAIQHAHQKGIIHCDIKPSNILVTELDGQPIPKVIDFGIARATDYAQPGNDAERGMFIGSPDYMSPEYARDGGTYADTRSDVFSLGAVLCELLAAALPYECPNWANLEPEQIRSLVQRRVASSPSEVFRSLEPDAMNRASFCRNVSALAHSRFLQRDMDCIALKALATDRDLRYDSAAALADDIRRSLDGAVPSAHPSDSLYRMRKFVTRNRVPVLAAALAVCSLTAGLCVAMHLYVREQQALKEQIALRHETDLARANESLMRRRAEAGELVARAAVKISYGKVAEAEEMMTGLSLDLVQPSLESSLVFRSLGEWHAMAGRWDEAAHYLSALAYSITAIDENDTNVVSGQVLPAASALLESGDFDGYERFRRHLVERFGGTKQSLVAEQVIKSCLLRPAPAHILTALDASFSLVSKEEMVSSGDYHSVELSAWRAFSIGLMEHRRGNYKEALDWLEKCSASKDINEARLCGVRATMAMAAARLGNRAEAYAYLTEAENLLQQFRLEAGGRTESKLRGNWFDWVNDAVLAREASRMMDAR